jgi:hypothetical protein
MTEKRMPWFRLYHRMIDDDKLRLLDFSDRWHFVALCCLKCDGLLDSKQDDLLRRKVAVKLGVTTDDLEQIEGRLREVGLLDKGLNPAAWADLQFVSDDAAKRMAEYRKRKKKDGRSAALRNSNVTVTNKLRNSSVTVTAQDKDKDKDKDKGSGDYFFMGNTIRLNTKDFKAWEKSYHGISDLEAELQTIDNWWQGQDNPVPKNWFYRTSQMLNKRHQEKLADKKGKGDEAWPIC